MGASWIKWTKGLTRRREVLAMARELDQTPREIAATCMEFWEWADDNTTDGEVSGVDASMIDSIVSLPGFAAAMADGSVAWLELLDGPCVRLVNFDRHNGETAKQRAQAAERQSRRRVTQTSRANRDAKRDQIRGEEIRDTCASAHVPPVGGERAEDGVRTSPDEAGGKPPKTPDEPRDHDRHDDLPETMAAACGLDIGTLTRSERGRLMKAVAEVRAAGATPADVQARAAEYPRQCKGCALTPTALASNWSRLDPAKAKPSGRRALTTAEIEAMQ